MAALVGTELVEVLPISPTGAPSGGTEYVTTQDIANLGGGGGGSGIVRSVSSVSSNTSAGFATKTDYVYFCSGTMTLTLPTAVGNTNRYTVKNTGVGTITIGGTIDGAVNPTIATQYNSVDIISNNTTWDFV